MKIALTIITLFLASCEGPMLPYSKEISSPIGHGIIPTSIPMYKENLLAPQAMRDFVSTNTVPWYGSYTSWGDAEDAANVNLLIYQKFFPLNGKWNVPFVAQNIDNPIPAAGKVSDSFWNNSLPKLFG